MTNVITHTDANGVTREYNQVKRRAKAGELIRVVNVIHTNAYNKYQLGDVLTVASIDNHNLNVDVVERGQRLLDHEYVVLEPTDVVVHDGKRYRTVKRKARDGEKVLVASWDADRHQFHDITVGEVLTAKVVGRDGDVPYVNERRIRAIIARSEYLVLEPLETAACETSPASSSADCRIAALEERVAALEERLGGESVRDALVSALRKHQPSPKTLSRYEIVAKAKADVETLASGEFYGTRVYYVMRSPCRVEWCINRDERTVVCRLYNIHSNDIKSRATAHCSPGDCFNVHIGKAIALRRALGLTVPDDYTNVPQPTLPQAGDIVCFFDCTGDPMIHTIIGPWTKYETGFEHAFAVKEADGYSPFEEGDYIIDDSRDGGECK